MSLFQRNAGTVFEPMSRARVNGSAALRLWRNPLLLAIGFALSMIGCTGGGGKPQITSITFASNAQGTDVICTTASLSDSTSPVCTAATLPSVVVGGSSIYVFANVASDDELLGVTWTVTCSSSGSVSLQSVNTACGTFSPVQTSSGPIPIYQSSGIVTTYSAPSTVPKAGNVTITASATSQPTVMLSVTLPVTAETQSKLDSPVVVGGRSDRDKSSPVVWPTESGKGSKAVLGI
jgi:hypothetical protein